MGMVQPIAGSAAARSRTACDALCGLAAAVCYGRAVRELTKACGVGRCHLAGLGDLLNGPFKMAGGGIADSAAVTTLDGENPGFKSQSD